MCSNFIKDFANKVVEKLDDLILQIEQLKIENKELKNIIDTKMDHCSFCYVTNLEDLELCYNCNEFRCLKHVYMSRECMIHHTFCNEECFSEFKQRRYNF